MKTPWRHSSKDAAKNAGQYCLPVPNNDLAPRFFEGEIVVIDPRQRLKDGQYAVLWLKERQYIIAKFYGEEGEYYKLQYNLLREPTRIARSRVNIVHKIMGCIEAKPEQSAG